MTIKLIPATALQTGDKIITNDNHEWSVRYLEGPDKCGCMDAALIDNSGNQKIEILGDQVKLVV